MHAILKYINICCCVKVEETSDCHTVAYFRLDSKIILFFQKLFPVTGKKYYREENKLKIVNKPK